MRNNKAYLETMKAASRRLVPYFLRDAAQFWSSVCGRAADRPSVFVFHHALPTRRVSSRWSKLQDPPPSSAK